MSLSSNLKTLQSMARSLDYLHTMLTVKDISLEDYIFVCDLLNKLAALHKLLEGRNVVLEITEDVKGVPTGHRLFVEKPEGGTLGVTSIWGKDDERPPIPWEMIPFSFRNTAQKDLRGEPLNARDAGLEE